MLLQSVVDRAQAAKDSDFANSELLRMATDGHNKAAFQSIPNKRDVVNVGSGEEEDGSSSSQDEAAFQSGEAKMDTMLAAAAKGQKVQRANSKEQLQVLRAIALSLQTPAAPAPGPAPTPAQATRASLLDDVQVAVNIAGQSSMPPFLRAHSLLAEMKKIYRAHDMDDEAKKLCVADANSLLGAE